MPSKNPAQRLSDIIDNVDAIIAFTAGPRPHFPFASCGKPLLTQPTTTASP
jgi:hypothetical protein